MFDAFPFSEWGEEIAGFWTFGPEESTGTWIIITLGFILMIGSFIGFVRLENGKLDHQAEALRATGALDKPAPPAAPTQS